MQHQVRKDMPRDTLCINERNYGHTSGDEAVQLLTNEILAFAQRTHMLRITSSDGHKSPRPTSPRSAVLVGAEATALVFARRIMLVRRNPAGTGSGSDILIWEWVACRGRFVYINTAATKRRNPYSSILRCRVWMDVLSSGVHSHSLRW